MPLTGIPFAINIMIGVAIWSGELSIAIKVILTVFLTLKFATYFYSVLMTDSNLVCNIGLCVCGLLNLGGITYSAVQEIWAATVLFVILLALLLIWRMLLLIDFLRKGGKGK